MNLRKDHYRYDGNDTAQQIYRSRQSPADAPVRALGRRHTLRRASAALQLRSAGPKRTGGNGWPASAPVGPTSPPTRRTDHVTIFRLGTCSSVLLWLAVPSEERATAGDGLKNRGGSPGSRPGTPSRRSVECLPPVVNPSKTRTHSAPHGRPTKPRLLFVVRTTLLVAESGRNTVKLHHAHRTNASTKPTAFKTHDITLSGGSLGSCVDEERSQLRELM